jgi:DNA-binding winged helix-turn-helix (wHTH) protein
MAADALPQPPLRFDAFELDPDNCRLRRRDALVDLPPQALKILLLLASHPNELVTRKEIKEALWPGESYGDFDSRLNFAIKKLRESLGDAAEQPRYVKTVRNAGYVFIAPVQFTSTGIVPNSQVVPLEEIDSVGPIRNVKPTESNEAHSTGRQRLRPGYYRSTFLTLTIIAAGIAVVLIVAMHSHSRPVVSSTAVDGPFQPGFNDAKFMEIGLVSPIVSSARQQIVIHGRGFGLHVPYARTDSPYLAIRDKTANWAAGRLIPQNWDEVTVDVQSWTDSEIVISGFSGDYGKNGWKLAPGDDVEIAVWNPQSGVGPELYHVRVTSQEAAQ